MKILYFLTFITLFSIGSVSAQAPVISQIAGASSVCSTPASPQTFSVSATNLPTYFTWVITPAAGAVVANPLSSVTPISFPNTNLTYTVSCFATNNFGNSSVVTKIVKVWETPKVTFSGSYVVCQGSPTNLSASPTIISASSTLSYSWSPATGLSSSTSGNVSANPPVNTTYTVLLTIGSCTNTTQVPITLSTCTGINDVENTAKNNLLIYPNPNNGSFSIRSDKEQEVVITNELGQTIRRFDLKAGDDANVYGLQGGIYFIVTPTSRHKIVVTR